MKAHELSKIAAQANSRQHNAEYKLIISQLEYAAKNGKYSISAFKFRNPATLDLLIEDGFKVDKPVDDPNEHETYYGNISFPKSTSSQYDDR